MPYNFIILFLYLFIIIIAVIGYGLIFYKFIDKKKKLNNFGYLGLLGLFFLTLYSYVSHLFYPHSLIHNSIIIALGCIAFILKIKKFNFIKKDFLILFGIFFYYLVVY